MPGHLKSYKKQKTCHKEVQIPFLLDSGSTLSLIPENLIAALDMTSIQSCQSLNINQTQGQVHISEKVQVHLRIGNIRQSSTLYLVRSYLPYAILGTPELEKFHISMDFCSHTLTQDGVILNYDQNISNQISDRGSFNHTLTFMGDTSCKKSLHSPSKSNQATLSQRGHCCLDNQTLSEYDDKNFNHSITEENLQLEGLLADFKDIFARNRYDVGRVRWEPQRIILTSELPISLRPYRASPRDNAEIQKQIQELLEAKLIKESCSSYSSPVTLAYKKGEGKTRLCVDYRRINAITKTDSEPLPRIDWLLDRLVNARYFSTLDLASGYWHIPLHPSDTEKLAFVTNQGLYEWVVLPFGYKNAPAQFARVLRRILDKHKINFATNYFDDFIVYSNSYAEHMEHLKTIFNICRQENLKLKFSKCNFAKSQIDFLGYEISNGQIKPDNANTETIKKLSPPKNVKELQRFLGSINVYHKFIDRYAKIRAPLNKLLKKDTPWEWSEICQQSFELLKNALISRPILKLFNPNLPCHLYTDASKEAVGAVLKQMDDKGNLHPIAFHSRQLRPYEQNYAVTELECLAIIDALDKFHYYIHGKPFTIHTDHAALVWLKKVKQLTGRLFRWSLKLSMYDYTVKYNKGSTNVEADMLSRNPILNPVTSHIHLLTLDEIKEHQELDNVTGPKYKKINDILVIHKKGFQKIVVPFSLREKILITTHTQFGHPGIQKMLNLISPQYYWGSMTQDITKFVKHCEVCQLNKKSNQPKFGLLEALPPAEQPFDIVSLDTVGGFNYYNSAKKYMHLVIDHATRYVWGFASKNVTTQVYINILKQIFNIQIPKKILTDRNPAFTASKFRKWLTNHNVKKLLTSSHRPQCNGKNERVNQSICTRLRLKVNAGPSKIPWPKVLEEVINEYNNTPHSVTKYPPAYLMFGQLPYPSVVGNGSYYPTVEEARKEAFQRTGEYHLKNKIRYDLKFVEAPFKPGDLVITEEYHYPNTRKLSPPFSGPYQIIEKLSNVSFRINKPNWLTKQDSEVIHASKLRYFLPNDQFKLTPAN